MNILKTEKRNGTKCTNDEKDRSKNFDKTTLSKTHTKKIIYYYYCTHIIIQLYIL